MKKLANNDYRLLTNIFSLDQDSLKRVLSKYLKKKYQKVYSDEAYLYAEGNIPIALVAHMDTVFDKPPKEVYYDDKKGVMWSPYGLGADDRAGIFAILKILLTTDLRPSIIFTTDEEMGGIGAKKLVNDFSKPAVPTNFLIELDRRGIDDCVFYEGNNSNFVNFIEGFGFSEAWGSFSDISIISPVWRILGVNLSIGYENEHSKTETLHIPHMLNTIKKVKEILSLPVEKIPSFKYKENKNSYFKYLLDTPGDEYLLYDYIETCDNCGALTYDYEMIPVKTIRSAGDIEFFCPECAEKKIDWCINCGNPYLIEDEGATEALCPYCSVGKQRY